MIDKLQVGEYCRTAGGRIFKVSEVATFSGCNYIPKDENKTLVVSAIVKHSPNLIDIIEAGDYVNGNMVIDKPTKKWLNVCTNIVGNSRVYDWGIKSIVTKEQLASVIYKVEE